MRAQLKGIKKARQEIEHVRQATNQTHDACVSSMQRVESQVDDLQENQFYTVQPATEEVIKEIDEEINGATVKPNAPRRFSKKVQDFYSLILGAADFRKFQTDSTLIQMQEILDELELKADNHASDESVDYDLAAQSEQINQNLDIITLLGGICQGRKHPTSKEKDKTAAAPS